MLTIYPVTLLMARDAALAADRIGRRDPDLARQLRRAAASVPLNTYTSSSRTPLKSRRGAMLGPNTSTPSEKVSQYSPVAWLALAIPGDSARRSSTLYTPSSRNRLKSRRGAMLGPSIKTPSQRVLR